MEASRRHSSSSANRLNPTSLMISSGQTSTQPLQATQIDVSKIVLTLHLRHRRALASRFRFGIGFFD